MNIKQINELRATAGLPALAVDTDTRAAQVKRQRDNHAARAAANRDLKTRRASGKKG